MESKHTPGPLAVLSANWQHGLEIRDAQSNLLAVAFDPSTSSHDVLEANARLWAEATNVATETGLTPRQLAEQRSELLEALTSIESVGAGWPLDEGRTTVLLEALLLEALMKCRETARAAIAKATGDDSK